MANTITSNNSSNELINALLAPSSGITITSSSLTSAPGSANLYDGGLQGIGAGILLTSGVTPGILNDNTSYGDDNLLAGDAALDAVVNTVFQTQSFNATKLNFSFTVTDPAATSVSFDLVFGSEEFPEWVDAYVDVAVVLVNGVNVALFNHDPSSPLSVISPNLAAGYFVDNANGALPTQYDGVSKLLKFVAPIQAGINTITIGIADTGDAILDSGIFVSNLSAGTTPGSGVVSAPGTGTSGPDNLMGSSKAEYFDLQSGDDTVYAAGGDDIVVAGAGNDVVYGGSGADEIKGDAGDDLIDGGADSDTAVYGGDKSDYDISFDNVSGSYTVSAKATGLSALDGSDALVGVEFAKFGDGTTWALSTTGVVSQTETGGPVTPPTNQPGTVFLSGVGAVGQTLTAKVSDADGVVAADVIYAWQVNGTDAGASGSSFVVDAGHIGQSITVTAQYIDLSGNAESLTSTAKAIAGSGNGDFAITLLQLKAPIGASVLNPLTTLVQNAIELGVSPNEAGIIIKSALGIAPTVNLQHDDSWAALQANPTDEAALAVEKVLVQVAVLTSLGSDETGMALTQAILLANSNGVTLNLADTTEIASFLGLDVANLLVQEIVDRNDNIGAAKSKNGLNAVEVIEGIWADIQSGLDVVLSDTIGTLSVHINQAPIGSANATLAGGNEGNAYVVSASELLAGFNDPEGDALYVANLVADHGSVTMGAGNFTITPTVGYSGPIELTYSVVDDLGLEAPATQLFVVTPDAVTPPVVNKAPDLTGAAATLLAGTEDTAYTISAADLLAGYSDVDSDTLSVSSLTAINGTLSATSTGWTFTPNANFNGPVALSYNVTDANSGSTAAMQNFNLTAVNDAPVLSGMAATLAAGTEDTAYVITAASLLAGFTDADGDTLSLGSLTTSNGSLTANGTDWTFTPAANFNGPVALSYNVTDANGGSTAATQNFSLTAVNDAPVAVADTGSTYALTPVLINVLVNDFDVDSSVLSIKAGSLVANPSQGTASIVGNQIEFTSAANFTGLATLSYTLTDGLADSAATNVVITVSATPVTPVTTNVILGTTANDKLTGTNGNDWIDGGIGADTMAGGLGDDTYLVDNKKDKVFESKDQGIDTVLSGIDFELSDNTENLTLSSSGNLHGKGNRLANVLIGNAGKNELDGDKGDDILIGGGGQDKLVGGDGADIFKFLSLADSVVGSKRDTIEDFKVGQDRIDISMLDAIAGTEANEAFNLISTAFTHVAGQLRFDTAKSILSGDVNGDGVADFEITLAGVSQLGLESLIL